MLGDGTGDCEDFAILFCSLAEILGYDTVLISLDWEDEDAGHMLAGVVLTDPPQHTHEGVHYLEHNGQQYYTCEGTGYGHMIGDFFWDEPDTIEIISVDLTD